ncbi:MAG: hypothetical protein Q4B26_05455 [Eubacteriales bacterium]|nr:hypothetical protein [Eubacteriales bacterium]
MTVLAAVKARCGIPESVTIYDATELVPLICDAIKDMAMAGVPTDILPINERVEEYDPRTLTAIVLYVQMYRGNDRSDTNRYKTMYRSKIFKLMLEG